MQLPLGYTGAVITCLTFGFPNTPIVSWFKITNNGKELLASSDSPHGDDARFVSAELIFLNGFRSDDEANYVCSTQLTDVNSSVITIQRGSNIQAPSPCSVNSTIAFFQIRVFDTRCREWDENLKQRVASQFLRSLKGVTLLSTASNSIMLTQEPICSNNVENAVLFRGLVTATGVQPTKQIFCALKKWHELGPTFLINDSLRHVDRRCVFSISSQYESECPGFASAAPASIISTVVGGSASGFVLVGSVVAFGVALVVVRSR